MEWRGAADSSAETRNIVDTKIRLSAGWSAIAQQHHVASAGMGVVLKLTQNLRQCLQVGKIVNHESCALPTLEAFGSKAKTLARSASRPDIFFVKFLMISDRKL